MNTAALTRDNHLLPKGRRNGLFLDLIVTPVTNIAQLMKGARQ
jgi:hypothetical protein